MNKLHMNTLLLPLDCLLKLPTYQATQEIDLTTMTLTSALPVYEDTKIVDVASDFTPPLLASHPTLKPKL